MIVLQRRGQRGADDFARAGAGAAPGRPRGGAFRFESRTISSSVSFAADAAHRPRVLAGGLHRGHGQRLLPRYDAREGGGQDRHGPDHRRPQPRGATTWGSMVAFFPADAPRYTVLTTIETRAQAGKRPTTAGRWRAPSSRTHGRLHLQPRPRLVRPGRRRRPAPISRAGEGRRHRPDPPRGRPPLARASFDSRTGWGRAAVDSLSNVAITSLPDDRGVMPDDARHGAEGRAVRAREPRAEGPLLGAGAVVRQSIAAGTRIRPGAAVVITLD